MRAIQVSSRDRSTAGVLELVLATVALPLVRLPVALFSWCAVGPALGVNLGILAPHGVGVAYNDALMYFLIDIATFVTMIIGASVGAVTRRVQLAARIYLATSCWYCLGLVIATVVLLAKNPSRGAGMVEIVTVIVGANILIIWWSRRALTKSRAAGRI